MLHRTIFIGLGSTGCNTIDALQDIAYLSTGDAEMGGAWAYLKLDTAHPVDKTFCGDTAHTIHIEVDQPQIQTLRSTLQAQSQDPSFNKNKYKWLWEDGELKITAQKAGAGLSRRYARACMYYYWKIEGDHSKNICSWLNDMKTEFIAAVGPRSPRQIEKKLDNILNQSLPRPRVADTPFRVIIVAALGGGTGSGALLELADLIKTDGITTDNLACIAYPPSIDHPSTTIPSSNNRRYNAVETITYYEQFLNDRQSTQNLRPLFLISPSSDNYSLDADDEEAMKQLEYMGAMFLSRLNAAMDWDAIVIDLINQFGKDLHAWSVAVSGVRIPALEIKARKIFEAVNTMCNPANSQDPLNWFSNVTIHTETISYQAKKILGACFKIMEDDLKQRHSTLDLIRKTDFQRELVNNKAAWFEGKDNESENYLVDKIIRFILNTLKGELGAKAQVRSIKYMEALLERMKVFVNLVPGLNDSDLEKAYSLLRGDPPNPSSRTRLFTWYQKTVFEKAIVKIESKLAMFKNALEGINTSKDHIQMIKRREEARFYRNIVPSGFDIQIPSLSFLEMDSVYNLFTSSSDSISSHFLKKEMLKELSNKAQIPANTKFDRTAFSALEAKAFMRGKLEGPMLNLKNNLGMTLIQNSCFGGALTELISDQRAAERTEFNNSIADMNLSVQTNRVDPDMIRIISPLQLDAIKIWCHIPVDQLKINDAAYLSGTDQVADEMMKGDYYPPDMAVQNADLATRVLKCIIIATENQRSEAHKLVIAGVSGVYAPTSFSNPKRDYGITLAVEARNQVFLPLERDCLVDSIIKTIFAMCADANTQQFLKVWCNYIENIRRTDPGANARLDEFFLLGNLNLSLPNGKNHTIYRTNF